MGPEDPWDWWCSVSENESSKVLPAGDSTSYSKEELAQAYWHEK